MRYITFIGLTVLLAFCLNGQNEKQLMKMIHQLDSAHSLKQLTSIYSASEKYLRRKPLEWQWYYYAGFNALLIAFEEKPDEAEWYCQKADEHISMADSLSPDNSEIIVLRSMSATARLHINPGKGAIKNSKSSIKYADKAINLNSENPRAWLMKAKGTYYTPEALGGGCKAALKYYETAIEKFKTKNSSSATDPSWGSDMAENGRENCDQKNKQVKNGK